MTAKALYESFLRDVKDGTSPLAIHFNTILAGCKWGAEHLVVPVRADTTTPFDRHAIQTFGKYRLIFLGYYCGTVFFMNHPIGDHGAPELTEVYFSIDWTQTKIRLLSGEK
jgi:hypothetical protein